MCWLWLREGWQRTEDFSAQAPNFVAEVLLYGLEFIIFIKRVRMQPWFTPRQA